MKQSTFRLWLTQMWMENREEHRAHQEPVVGQQEYFNRYKYWLKREYKHQQRNRK